MRFRFAILLTLALALAGCKRESYSRSLSGFSALDKKVLYDFRADGPGIGSQLDAATSNSVMSAVFSSYVSEARECNAGAGRKRPGQIVPAIRGSAEGSFTAAGLKQTAYLIEVVECGRKLESARRRLAVFTAGTLTANVEAPVGKEILGVYDLDGDRKHELLLEDAALATGGLIKVARLVEFDKDRLVTVEDFGQILRDNCGTDVQPNSMSASAVFYLPPPAGQKARFTVELYRAECPRQGQKPEWTRVSGH